MVNLRQRELKEWQEYNFGESDISDIIHGMSEEIGEMSHWYLKGKQGIRGVTASQAKEQMADAFADTVIYGVQAMTALNLNAEDVLRKTLEIVLKRDWKNNPKGIGEAQHKEASNGLQ
jgi:NTP pyrophosphatase (non-canonical NTP hydrolase)